MTHKSKIIKATILHKTNWLELVQKTYLDENGVQREWDCVNRNNHSSAAVIIPLLVPSRRYLLIKQFRPPVEKWVVEFPAGLIDPHETPAECAKRELLEETGYLGQITEISPPVYSSSGMLAESFYYVNMEIDELASVNQSPIPQLEVSEFIEVIALTAAEVPSYLQAQFLAGYAIDAKVYAFFL